MPALTLTAAALPDLARKPGATAAFPFLKAAIAASPPGCCGEAKARAADLRAVLAQVASLPPARKAAFKALVGVETVRVPVVKAGRVMYEEF